MEIKINNVIMIRDKHDNIIFELPQNTLLDNILVDLWPTIAKYGVQYPFILCDYYNQLPGFRKIKREEFVSLKQLFSDYHEKNGGLINIQNIKNNGTIIFFVIDEYYVTLNGMDVVCIIIKNKIILMSNTIASNYRISNTKIYDTQRDIHLVLMIPDL